MPHFTLPPFDPPKPETLKIAHAVIAAKGQIKLTAEQAYNLARDTIGLSKVHMGVTHFLEQLETLESEKAKQRDERRKSDDSQSE